MVPLQWMKLLNSRIHKNQQEEKIFPLKHRKIQDKIVNIQIFQNIL